jgi:hypothetical protein
MMLPQLIHFPDTLGFYSMWGVVHGTREGADELSR